MVVEESFAVRGTKLTIMGDFNINLNNSSVPANEYMKTRLCFGLWVPWDLPGPCSIPISENRSHLFHPGPSPISECGSRVPTYFGKVVPGPDLFRKGGPRSQFPNFGIYWSLVLDGRRRFRSGMKCDLSRSNTP